MTRLPLSLILATVALAPAAHAQRPFVHVGGGATFPTGDLEGEEAQDVGWHAMVAMSYRPPAQPFGFRIEGAYHRLDSQEIGGVIGPSLRLVTVTANLILEGPGSAVRPYLIGGGGLYNSKFDDAQVRNDLGANGGLGLRFRLLGLDSFVEARYHAAFKALGAAGDERTATFVPVTFGLSF